jgi:hypothetical protein
VEIQNQFLSLGISDPVSACAILEDLTAGRHSAGLAYYFVDFVCWWTDVLLLPHSRPSCQSSYRCESYMSVVTRR